MSVIAYGATVAHKEAFNPPCSANAIRQAIRKREIRVIRIGVKPYLTADALRVWAETRKDYFDGRT